MGCPMFVKLVEGQDVNAVNQILKKMGVEHRFISKEDNQAWLDDINTNPDSPQNHLKPEDRGLTMEELKKIFPRWTEVGVYETDLHFSRTPQDQMQKIARFIAEHPQMVEYVTEVDTLLERGNIPEEYHQILRDKEKPYEEPEILPLEEQYIPDIQSGILLCRSFSIKPFWVMYGKVDNPKFLKTRVYVEDIYNNIYRDRNGYAYMLVPLYDFSASFAENVFNRAWDMGLPKSAVKPPALAVGI